MKKHIPNFITGLNAVSGCIAVYLAFSGELVLASLFVGLGAIFDFCDGMAARLLSAYSEIGKEMDSLADVISFGFAPSAIAYALLSDIYDLELLDLFLGDFSAAILLLPFVMVMFSALRLAKFNIDTRQTTSFIGLPTPANAILWASFPIILKYGEMQVIKDFVNNEWIILTLIFIMSFMLVAEIPMFSFKLKSLKLKDNYTRYIFLVVIVSLVASIGISALVFIIPMYVVFSIIENIFKKKEI